MQYDALNKQKIDTKNIHKVNMFKNIKFLKHSNKRILTILLLVAVVLILTFLFIGITPKNFGYNFPRRVKKVLSIILTGSSIAFSSVVFQTITNNRVLTPSVLGLDSLYMFIQTLVVYLFTSSSVLVANKNINFILCLGIMIGFSGVLFKIMFKRENNNVLFLVLIGMIFGSLFSSLSSFMQMLIDPNEFLIVQDKMFASFNNINTNILFISILSIAIIGIYIYRDIKFLDVLSLGRDNAINLGVDYERVVKRFLFAVAVLVSISTALSGPITFLGILVVNLAKELMKTYKHIYWFISAILISIIALVGGQLIVERLLNFSTSLSVIINFIGGVYFIYLLIKENKR
ncbi:iron complex transport system permease protein [Clostridium amylolyticum]|uniref:Iron complex transport system permease protein n=2 Tax=Clostridium amylolyticum TaxID=1121298 RepID=A0A1M6HEM9_9CLOT|nr:iron complex transport system permease protein [Clostridium amylolyticum]